MYAIPTLKSPELRLHYNNVYIVCGVVIENDKVLMIQEAKPSCRDKWYLPAGRMEENETIVVREWDCLVFCVRMRLELIRVPCVLIQCFICKRPQST